MTRAEITNYYEHKPESGKKPEQLVMLLHGLGSNGQDLISLAPFWAKYLPNAIFISPDAPFRCDMVPPGYPNSYQWFSLQQRAPSAMLHGASSAAPILQDFMKEQMELHDISAAKTALVGFSQGTMMSLYAGPRFGQRIAGILGYSGALVGEMDIELHKVPVHLVHGEADDVVPVAAYHHARKGLEQAGFTVSGHTTKGLPHSIDDKGIQSGADFLKSILI
jgi:phospholipase/carboxylesterase